MNKKYSTKAIIEKPLTIEEICKEAVAVLKELAGDRVVDPSEGEERFLAINPDMDDSTFYLPMSKVRDEYITPTMKALLCCEIPEKFSMVDIPLKVNGDYGWVYRYSNVSLAFIDERVLNNMN